MINGSPAFSWIDINVTELCNRKCIFCRRIDDDFYPRYACLRQYRYYLDITNNALKIYYNGNWRSLLLT